MERHWRLYIDSDAKNMLYLAFYPDQTEERCFAINWINQDVEITFVGIHSMQDRAEDTRIACIVIPDDLPDNISMQLEGF